MQITCEPCGKTVPVEDVNLDRMVAKCRACNAVFAISVDGEGPAPSEERPPAPMPKAITVTEELNGDLVIRRRWWTLASIFLIFFACVWNAFMVFFVSGAISSGAPPFMFVLMSGHAAVGFGVGYFAIASVVNTTVIRVGFENITVRHQPLPWIGRRTIASHEIDQLWAEERVSHSQNGHQVRYRVNARTHDGRSLRLLSGLVESDQALFIEQAIEKRLGIRDEAVAGEIHR